MNVSAPKPLLADYPLALSLKVCRYCDPRETFPTATFRQCWGRWGGLPCSSVLPSRTACFPFQNPCKQGNLSPHVPPQRPLSPTAALTSVRMAERTCSGSSGPCLYDFGQLRVRRGLFAVNCAGFCALAFRNRRSWGCRMGLFDSPWGTFRFVATGRQRPVAIAFSQPPAG